jgi:tRNA(Ile)-lysidine synthase
MTLLDRVAEFFQRHALADRAGVVAVSGGPDSVALAWCCVQLVRQDRLRPFTIAHLNHQLRGLDSDADEQFVRELPAVLAMPALHCVTERRDVAAEAQRCGVNLEAAARDVRYAWLAEVARRRDAAWVATGHSADDQAETVLHHLLRGSGLLGLSGMPEARPLAANVLLVRPLLAERRRDLEALLTAEKVPFRRDASNDDRRFTRNRIRLDLMPRLEQDYNPAVVDVLNRTAQLARDVQDELVRQAQLLLVEAEAPRAGSTIVLLRQPLERASRVQVREVFRLLWQREGWPMGDMTFDDWDRLAALAHGHAAGTDFPGGIRVRSVGKVLQMVMGAE